MDELIAAAHAYLRDATLSGSLTRLRAAEILADWPRRPELTDEQARAVVDAYPDPDDYEEQVSHR